MTGEELLSRMCSADTYGFFAFFTEFFWERQVNIYVAKTKKIADLIKLEGVDCKGFGIIAKIVMTDIDLVPGAKSLYAYFCSYAGAGTTAYPGRDKIIFDLKIGKDAYYTYLNNLLDNGYIRIEKKKEYPFNNIYIIVSNPPKLAKIAPVEIEGNDRLIVRGIKAFGYGTVPKAIMLDDRIECKAKALYAYFCSFAGNGSTAFPTRATIMFHLQITINPFQRYLRQLIRYNYIEVEQQHVKGRFAGNIYYLNDRPDEEKGLLELEKRAEKQKRKAGAQAACSSHTLKQDKPAEKKAEPPVPQKNTGFSVHEETPADKAARMIKERQEMIEFMGDLIDYDILKSNNSSDIEDVEMIFDIIIDTLVMNEPFVRVNKKDVPAEVVKSKFKKLNYERVDYVLTALHDTTTRIKNVRQYIITSLYNADTEGIYWANRAHHDLYGQK